MANSDSVCGIGIDVLNDAAKAALREYTHLSGLTFKFDPDGFALTPEKPNSARAGVQVTIESRAIGQALAIIFAPGDGTGDTQNHQLEDLDTYPLTLTTPGLCQGARMECIPSYICLYSRSMSVSLFMAKNLHISLAAWTCLA